MQWAVEAAHVVDKRGCVVDGKLLTRTPPDGKQPQLLLQFTTSDQGTEIGLNQAAFCCGGRAIGDTVLSLANMRSLLGSSRTSVLVVDDSPAMLRYLRVLLELESYQVETASNGAEALQRLKEGSSPAIVLLDVEMPGMDGIKTLRQLRRLRPDLKVIMCSGVEDPHTARRAALLGAQAFITKPVQHLYLSAAIERCLDAPVVGVLPRSSLKVNVPLKANVVKMPRPSRRRTADL